MHKKQLEPMPSKIRKEWNPEKMKKAVKAVRQNRIGLYKFSVPKTILRRLAS
jgi:hypothetical protein